MSDELDWETAKANVEAAIDRRQEDDDVTVRQFELWYYQVASPLMDRWDEGERTAELHEAMLAVN